MKIPTTDTIALWSALWHQIVISRVSRGTQYFWLRWQYAGGAPIDADWWDFPDYMIELYRGWSKSYMRKEVCTEIV